MYCRIHREYHTGLISKGLCAWRLQGNKLPKNYKEYKKLKDTLRDLGRAWNIIQKKTHYFQIA